MKVPLRRFLKAYKEFLDTTPEPCIFADSALCHYLFQHEEALSEWWWATHQSRLQRSIVETNLIMKDNTVHSDMVLYHLIGASTFFWPVYDVLEDNDNFNFKNLSGRILVMAATELLIGAPKNGGVE